MAFNSYLFFVFFALIAFMYGFTKPIHRWKLLLCASLVFIGYAEPRGIILLLLSCLVTYFCTVVIDDLYQELNGQIYREQKLKIEKKAKYIVVADIMFNIGVLFATKYLNFFGEVISSAAGFKFTKISVIVPLGISFYTFMIIGYAIDIYRKEYSAQRNFCKLLLFASYFPQLIDGPISRYGDIQEKLYNPSDIDYKRCKSALLLFSWGLFKKLCVADNVQIYVNLIFNDFQNYHGLVAFSGAIAYALFIYADFSGCIDMARGVSGYFGIELKNNFNHPYFAESVEDFWRRWHITLSTWFKDYLFYPILRSKYITKIAKKLRGGGYKRLAKILPTSIALLCVWIFTGLWHGARGTYILWGLYYGIIIIISNAFNVIFKRRGNRGPKWVSCVFTFFIICVGYIFFNSANTMSAFGMLRNVFSFPIIGLDSIKNLGIAFYKQVGAITYFVITIVSVVVFVITDFLMYKGIDIRGWISSQNRVIKYILAMAVVFFLLLMMNRTSGDFTYMQF